jgi:hypothetical protein
MLRQFHTIGAVLLVVAASHAAGDEGANHNPASVPPPATLLLVLGAEGTAEYGQQFREWAARWESAAAEGGAATIVIGRGLPEGDRADRDLLKQSIAEEAGVRDVPLWIVFIGHGTFDGRSAKFNLRGDDVAANELALWLVPLQRPVAVINCTSASFPFLKELSGPSRVVVTATKSGFEANYCRFGDYLSQAIGDLAADLDKDEQVSLLEAFLKASRRTQEFYNGEGRLATEHALIDDDGDGVGTRGDAFAGVRPVRDSETGALDGYHAHHWQLIPSQADRRLAPDVRRQRDDLEVAVFQLRDRKAELAEDVYFAELENLLVQLAELYERAGGDADDVRQR